MKHLIIISLSIILFIANPLLCKAQSTEGIIENNETFTNNSGVRLFYLPREKVLKLLDFQTKFEADSMRVLEYQKLHKLNLEKLNLCDSLTTTLSQEKEEWHKKLLETDYTLEEQRKINLQLEADKRRLRKQQWLFGGVGVLAGLIGGILLM
jgi:hypothetical protein